MLDKKDPYVSQFFTDFSVAFKQKKRALKSALFNILVVRDYDSTFTTLRTGPAELGSQ